MRKIIDHRAQPANVSASSVLSVDEAADYLRISKASLYRLFNSGSLKIAKVGGRTLVRRIDIDAFLQECVDSQGAARLSAGRAGGA